MTKSDLSWNAQQFTIQKSINIIYYISRLKGKTHTKMLIDTYTHTHTQADKIKHPVMINACSKLGKAWEPFQPDKIDF